jgi:hypothetical protein
MTQPESPLLNAAQFPLTSPVELVQLEAEINSVVGAGVTGFALTGPADPSQPISTTNQAILWVSPANLDLASIGTVVDSHSPNEPTQTPFMDLLVKLAAEPDAALTEDEKDLLLRGTAQLAHRLIAGRPIL